MQTVAISWLMATISTSDLMVALVQASSTLPAFILSVFVGAIADNFSRRRVMFAGWCLMAAASAMLTAVVTLGFVDPWMILGFSFLIAWALSTIPLGRPRLATLWTDAMFLLPLPSSRSASTLYGPLARRSAASWLPYSGF
ncbi:hypothetical protein X733_32435 [Mesorhizobium sp. L2C067A000]|nr:hypothetical protein X733_32435 [Mesorhizobium sp. L2C067A000]